jgi:FKBP-type peptidyl-prolyl cis-trans isomerase (trigger factor)
MSHATSSINFTQSYNAESFEEEIVLTITKEDFQKYFENALQEISKGLKVPGFRKGKAPRSVILSKYQEDIFDRAVEIAVKTYVSRIDNFDPKPISPFIIKNVKQSDNENNGDIEVMVAYLPMPSVILGDVDKLVVDRPDIRKASEEEVDNELRNVWYVYAKKLDGNVKKEDFSREKINKEFLENTGITKDNPEIKSYDDLRNLIEQYINETYKTNYELEYEKAIVSELIRACTYVKLEGLVNYEVEQRIEDYISRLRNLGVNVHNHLQGSDIDIGSLRAAWWKEIEESMKLELLLQEYVRQHGVEVSNEDIETELNTMDKNLKKRYDFDNGRLRSIAVYRLTNRKAYELLINSIKSRS